MKIIVAVGDVVAGFNFYGPFHTYSEAQEWAGQNAEYDNWSTFTLKPVHD